MSWSSLTVHFSASQGMILPSVSKETSGSNTLSMAKALLAVIWLFRSKDVVAAARPKVMVPPLAGVAAAEAVALADPEVVAVGAAEQAAREIRAAAAAASSAIRRRRVLSEDMVTSWSVS